MVAEPLPGGHTSPVPIDESLDPVLKALGGPAGSALGSLFENWDDLVGIRLAEHTRPSGLREGALVIAVDDPGWASQVRWMSTQILERIASQTGPGVVGRLEVRVESSL